MNLIIDRLLQDHKQMTKVLFHLGREVREFCNTRQQGSLDSILEIIDFIRVYPEVWHHPIEEYHLRSFAGEKVTATWHDYSYR